MSTRRKPTGPARTRFPKDKRGRRAKAAWIAWLLHHPDAGVFSADEEIIEALAGDGFEIVRRNHPVEEKQEAPTR